MSALSFGSPAILISLLLLPLAWWALQRERRRRSAQLQTFGDESLLAGSSALPVARRRLGGQALHLGALALGVVALARPQLGDRPASLAQAGRDLLVLLDLSRSMNAAQGQPGAEAETRLAVAKRAVAAVLAAAPGDRVGLIVFGGSAFLQLPLTSSHAAFQRYLDAASSENLGDPSTSLASALTAAATTFEHDGQRGYQSVLLVSDGETGADDLAPSLTRLRRAGIPVFAIGVGSPEGAPVPADSAEAPEKWHRDHIGRIAVSRLEEGDLRRAARETGGAYVRWSAAAAQGLGTELSRMEKRTISSREGTERMDRFQWPLGLALAALVLEPMLGVTARRKRR
ncbi:MAG TPA: VWA domain-containing protein [Gemmatimonadales bacterium]|jgi:Ca-activated chloride channel family protein|nr:VWA domain-containing protein [Gemmatimonadales bacterium]